MLLSIFSKKGTFFWDSEPRLQTVKLSGRSCITWLGKLWCHSNPCVFFIIYVTPWHLRTRDLWNLKDPRWHNTDPSFHNIYRKIEQFSWPFTTWNPRVLVVYNKNRLGNRAAQSWKKYLIAIIWTGIAIMIWLVILFTSVFSFSFQKHMYIQWLDSLNIHKCTCTSPLTFYPFVFCNATYCC